MLRITLVLLIVGEAVAQINSKIACPVLKPIDNFDLKAFSRKWYEYAKYANERLISTKCVTILYHPFKDGSFEIKDTVTEISTLKTSSSIDVAKPIRGGLRHGKFTLTTKGGPYDILATDYKNYALVWSCSNVPGGSLRSAWIYTRVKDPLDQVIGSVYAAVNAYGIETSNFLRTIKSTCPNSY